MKTIKSVFFIFLAMTIMSVPASAADSAEEGWKWRLAPLYFWAINLSGDQTIGPITAPIDLKLSDVFDNLEGVFTANFEGRYNNKWGFLTDFTWVDIKGEQGPLTVKFQYVLAEVDGYYRFNRGKHNFDALLGLRYTSQDTKIEPTPLKVSESWTDPIIGGRWSWNFAEKWALVARGDIGGFGVGSDFTWQALGLIDWQPFKYVSFIAGYRGLYQDYKDDNFKYDATTHGPLLGVNIKW